MSLKKEPEKVITDQAMPQMTGSQLSIELWRMKPSIPIILATGHAELPPGMDLGLPRLSKPFSLSDLAASVMLATAPETAA